MNISVLMPTYNNSKYIKYAIQSILNQSYKEFEFLIVDDGSTDNTEEIVKSFIDSRINYIKKPHEGIAKSLNFGLKKATYDIIAIMDSDDISFPTRLEKQIKLFRKTDKTDFRIVSSWYCAFSKKKILYIVKIPEYNNDIKRNLLLHSVICHAGSMYDREVILNCGGYNHKFNSSVDYNLWIRLIDKVKFHNIQEVLYFYRMRNNSISNKNFKETLCEAYKVQSYFYEKSLVGSNLLKNKWEEIFFRGWREFFYGDKIKARSIWADLKFKLFDNPKVLIAIIISFFPQKLFLSFKKARVNFRIQYYLKCFSKNNINLRKHFNELNK